jgi:hypothetical protein
MQIDPDSLTEAAVTIGELGEAVHDPTVCPALNAKRGVDALAGSPIAAALGSADAAHTHAQTALGSRYNAIAELLSSTAAGYTGQDQSLADQLAGLADLNSKGN